MSFSLTDGIAHYRASLDEAHRFWAYHQFVAAGAVAFAWSREEPGWPLLSCVSAAFLAFAYFNGRLVVSAQAAAVSTRDWIHDTAKELGQTDALAGILSGINAEKTKKAGRLHDGVTVVALLAIWLAYFRPLVTAS